MFYSQLMIIPTFAWSSLHLGLTGLTEISTSPVSSGQYDNDFLSINLQKFGLRFRIIFIHLVPCVTLICLNAKLIYGVAEAEKKRKALTNRNFRMANKDGRLLQKPKMRDLHRVSAMSAVIISVFLLLEIPLMVITILHAVQPNGDTNETVSQIIKKNL